MNINVNFVTEYITYQGIPAIKVNFLVVMGDINLGNYPLELECSLGNFIVNDADTEENKIWLTTNGSGWGYALIAAQDSGEGELIVKRQNSGKQIGVLKYHFKSTAKYTLDFKIIKNNAMSDGIQANIVEAILTGEGAGVNISDRKLDLCITGYGTFKKSSSVKTISVTTSESGKVSIEIYDTNIDGEDVTLTGVLDLNKMVKATAQIHFQNNMDCDANPPQDGIYNRTIFTYSINNQQYLLRQRECDHLVTVHKLLAGGKQGEQTSTGQKWVSYYDLMFPFILENEQYFFGLASKFIDAPNDIYKSYWVIAKLDKNGHKSIVDEGYWKDYYDVGFAYSVDGNQFIYLHGKNKNMEGRYSYMIREILPNAKMGDITEKHYWDYFYEATFYFSMDNKAYLYGQSRTGYKFFSYELDKNGYVGKQVESDSWADYYDVQFPYIIDGKHYYAGQRFDDKLWFVSDMYDGGKPQREIIHSASWDVKYQYQIPFFIDGKAYFLRQDKSKEHWRITQLLPGPDMGQDTDSM